MKLPSKPIMAGAATLVALGGTAAFLLAHRAAAPVVSSTVAPPSTSVHTGLEELGPVNRKPGCLIEPGTELGYEISVDTSVTIDPVKLGLPTGEPMDQGVTSAKATIDLRALSRDDNGAVLLARYRNVDERTRHEGSGLGAPFLLRVNASCQITGFARGIGTTVREGRAAQALAYEMSWSWPSSGAAELEGENNWGAYSAEYKQTQLAPRPVVERHVLAYKRVWADEWERQTRNDKPKPQKPLVSGMTVDPGDSPWFHSLHGVEKVSAEGQAYSLTITTHVQPRPPSENAFTDAPGDMARYIWEDLLPRRVKPREIATRTRAERMAIDEARKLTVDQAVTNYRERLGKNTGIQDSWPQMARFLEAHPEKTHEIMERARSGELAGPNILGVFMAMGQARTTEARDELLAVKSDTGASPLDRSRAALNLIDRPDVGIELAHSLQADAKNTNNRGASDAERLFGRHAGLALSVMAALHGDEEPAIKAAAVSAIKDQLANARTATELSPAMGMIGNLGDASLLPLAVPYMSDPDLDVRVKAADTLRRMSPQETLETTLGWLRTEKSLIVKRAIYNIVQDQYYDAHAVAAPALVAQAAADLGGIAQDSAFTRTSIIHLLGPAAKESPAAKAALLAQVGREFQRPDNGLGPILAQYLTADEITQAAGSALVRVGAVDPKAGGVLLQYKAGETIPGSEP